MLVQPAARRQVGSTKVSITAIGMGSAPLGNMYAAIDEGESRRTIAAALESGIGYLDTAPLYGFGLAEQRIGEALRGVSRNSYTLSSKVGRLIVADPDAADPQYVGVVGKRAVFDFSRDGVLRSLEESLQRLGVDRVDIVYIHDPDDHWQEAIDGAYPTLAQLKSEGVIGAIGAGMNQVEMLARFVAETDIDAVLCAGRYSLLDQSADRTLFPLCLDRGVSVIIGGVYNSGVLADPYAAELYYDYKPAADPIVTQARLLDDICASHGVPLRAAALQFPLRHEAVTSVLTGVRAVAEVADNAQLAVFEIPDALWAELDAAIAGSRA